MCVFFLLGNIILVCRQYSKDSGPIAATTKTRQLYFIVTLLYIYYLSGYDSTGSTGQQFEQNQ